MADADTAHADAHPDAHPDARPDARPDRAIAGAEALVETLARMPGVLACRMEKGEVVAHVRADTVAEVALVLRDGADTRCEQVMDICGVDWPEREQRFDVVYNLLSISHNHRIRLVAAVAEGEALPSVCGVWPAATWWEREVWDLFGIPFTGQPDLRRILTDYGFEGHPLRKDFPLTGYTEVRYDEDRKQVVYEPVHLTQDFRNFDFLSPWEALTTLPGDEKAHETRAEGGLGQAAIAPSQGGGKS